MALIDLLCSNGHDTEAYRAAADWPSTPPCPDCGAPTEQAFRPRATRWTVDPVLVFRAPDGSCRFPGVTDGASVAHYQRLGYERVEIRGAAEMRAFESRMNKHEYAAAQRKSEAQAEAREQTVSARHAELRNQMQGMSERGKAIARVAMDATNAKPRQYARDSGFHSDIYNHDRGNRAESRDPQGRRRRD